MKDFAERFYKSKAWQRVREQVWKRDRGLCHWCLNKGIIRQGEEVHHLVELTPETIRDESISLNPDNLVTLCRECHGTTKRNRGQRYKLDELGRVIITEDRPPSKIQQGGPRKTGEARSE